MDAALADQLGGPGVVRLVVTDLYRRVLADETISGYFAATDVDTLAEHVTDVLVHVLGVATPGTAVVEQITRAHVGLGVTDEAFDRLVGHLLDALSSAGVRPTLVDQAVERIAALRNLVV